MEVTKEVTKNIPIPPGPGKEIIVHFIAIEWQTGKGNAKIYSREIDIRQFIRVPTLTILFH